MAQFKTLMNEVEIGTKMGKKDVFDAGQVLEVRGLYEDESDAGVAVGVVVRVPNEANTVFIRFIEAADDSWGWHLFERPESTVPTLVKLMRNWGDSKQKKIKGVEVEWISSWRLIANKSEEPDFTEIPWISSSAKVAKSIKFVREWMCAEKVGVKATFPLRR
jgi:hypothetical protein